MDLTLAGSKVAKRMSSHAAELGILHHLNATARKQQIIQDKLVGERVTWVSLNSHHLRQVTSSVISFVIYAFLYEVNLKQPSVSHGF